MGPGCVRRRRGQRVVSLWASPDPESETVQPEGQGLSHWRPMAINCERAVSHIAHKVAQHLTLESRPHCFPQQLGHLSQLSHQSCVLKMRTSVPI